MNEWDRIFWVMFVVLEAAIIVGNIWVNSPVALILGFVVILIGTAKLGDDMFRRSMHHDHLASKETINKMRNWLNRQYELTQGIKDLHEHRLHKVDRKRTELEEILDKRYRELAGKMIDIENRLSLVGRAVISSHKRPAEAGEPAKGKAGKPGHPGPLATLEKTAEHVWQDIVNLAKKKKSIATLSRGVKNRILKVQKDRIVLRSEMTKTERHVHKQDVHHFWNILSRKGKLHFPQDIADPAMVRIGSIMISFLARLPYIEHSTKPRILHYMGENTHSLGTLQLYAK